ncbi:MAG: pilus assembly protein PilM [Candidatus Komeilibacteria bacterium]|nr:pilus assembly protein PilM [Candidatus Komeilibacteria bacterium]
MWRSHFNIHSFALDISEATLRLVQLKKGASGIRLVSFGEISLPEGVLVNGQIKDNDKVVSHLKELIHRVNGQYILTPYVRACLPEPKSFIKLVDLTYPNSTQVESEISSLISQHFPYNADEVYWDWQYLDSKDKTKILLGVCPKTIIDNYQEVLEQAGLYPLSLEIEAEAIVRSSVPTNSTTLTALLTQALRVKQETAETIKYQGLVANQTPDAYRQILESYFQPLIEHLHKAQKFQEKNFPSLPLPQGVILSGGLSNMPGLVEYLQKNLPQAVVIANPLMKIARVVKDFSLNQANSYATAIGLALHEYN